MPGTALHRRSSGPSVTLHQEIIPIRNETGLSSNTVHVIGSIGSTVFTLPYQCFTEVIIVLSSQHEANLPNCISRSAAGGNISAHL